MGFIGKWFKGLGKRGRYILFGSIAGVVIIACVLIICVLFGGKKKDRKPDVPAGSYLVYRLVSEYQVNDGEKHAVQLCEYDERGNLLSMKKEQSATDDLLFDEVSEYTYNENDRPVLIQTTYLSGDVRTEKREYNSDNRLIKAEITGPDSSETRRYSYDGYGNLSLEEDYDASGTLTHSIAFESDENGLLFLLNDKVYSDGKLVEESIYRWETRPDGTRNKVNYRYRKYNADNELMVETEREGVFDGKENLISEYRLVGAVKYDVTEYELTYDKNDRLTKSVQKNSDADDFTEYYKYDKNGNLVSLERWDAVNHYEYDSYGNVIKEYLTYPGEASMTVTDYTEYTYKPFVIPKDLLTDEERDKLGIN